MDYFKGIKFCRYLILQLENNYILQVSDFVILVKTRIESLTEYHFLLLINVIVIKYATETLISLL